MILTAKDISENTGLIKSAVLRRAKKEYWEFEVGKNHIKKFPIKGLPADIQKKIVEQTNISPSIIPTLAPEAAFVAAEKVGLIQGSRQLSLYNNDNGPGTAIDIKVIQDEGVRRWAKVIQEAQEVPDGWQARKWIDAVAVKHDTTASTIYRKIAKFKKTGIDGLKHIKSNLDQPKTWSPEALDWWVGLVLKREHRRMAKDALYELLQAEASGRGWRIGTYESALWWLKRKVTPQLQALQNGGARALDNILPPVLRNYADLAPFEMLVGDQHKFDFWVIDDDTGELIRPEGYFWQDLRTRCLYGGALDRKYDSYLIGLALRMGLKIFGAFGSIYTDNGKPELSRYIMYVLKDMRTIGLNAEREIDAFIEIDGNEEDCNPCVLLPGTHKKAIVKNAKAKMIEGTFKNLEGILRDHFQVPGYVKRLGASGEENDIDEADKDRLARSVKLLSFWEFTKVLFEAMDYYNSQKPHSGVLKEWAWRPKPKVATPMECLSMCHLNGWKPGKVSQEAVDVIFLPRAARTIDRGRLQFRKMFYEHDDLISMHQKDVQVRFDPLDPEWLYVFDADGKFICTATPAEYSSMKNSELAARKIEEKARRRKGFILEYRRLTEKIPDFRKYSTIPEIEKAAAIMGRDKQKQLAERNETCRIRTNEELALEVKKIEAPKERRPVFATALDRYQWCIDQIATGKALAEIDKGFAAEYEARMDPATREYWDLYKDSLNHEIPACGGKILEKGGGI